MTLFGLLAALVPLAWLLPNHYVPWMSAWSEALALGLVGAAALAIRGRVRLPAPVLGFVVLAAASVTLQWATGRLFFGGDAIVVLLFLMGFALAVAVGHAAGVAADGAFGAVDLLALGVLAAALVSVVIAVLQWLGVPLGLWGLPLPPGSRPYANIGQPNLLCSALFLGLCGAAVLHERGRFGAVVLWGAWLPLAAGIVMTGSRTGWMQVALLAVLCAAFRRRASLRIGPLQVLALAAVMALAWAAWPALNDAMQLSGSRPVSSQAEAGVRVPYWEQMVDAITRHPWQGYGWQQVVMAQWEVALDHPPLQRQFEQSHNLGLDFVLWAGVPVGLALSGLVVAMFAGPLARCRSAAGAWLLAGALGVGLHGLVEYPLQFAYLLLPAGLFLGAAGALGAPARTWSLPLPTGAVRTAGLAFVAVLAIVGREYLEAEQNNRLLLLETARIGTLRVESPGPDLRWLTQLSAFLHFVRTEPRPAMSAGELETMRRAAMRFAYAPSMSRYALALAMNGREPEALQTMARLCAMHRPDRCRAAHERWAAAREVHPTLPLLPAPPP